MKQNNYFQRMLSAMLLLMASSLSWAYDFSAENADGVTIYYNLINDGTEAEVTSGSVKYLEEIVIPSTVAYNDKTLSVTSIGDKAFFDCGDLPSITIPEGVTSIGERAFFGCGLTSVTIPGSVRSIGDEAFGACWSLTSVTILEGVTSIGDFAFAYCGSLTSVNIPNSVTSIGDFAFAYCSSLTSVTIPNSVTSFGAFQRCSSLTSVTIGKNVTSIYYDAFRECSNLTFIIVDKDNPVYDSRDNCNAIIETAYNTLILGCQNTIIPESVTRIGYEAFRGCSSLTSITIPEGVTSIDSYVFDGCTNLTSVYSLIENPFSIGISVFKDIAADATLYVPQGTKEAYEATEGWTTYFSNVVELNATSISEVNPGQSAEGYAVYDLNGTKVNVKDGDLKSLPRGIYVVNGKKTIVK